MSAPAKSIGEVQWSQPATKGDKPAPRSGHTITVVGDKAVVFGGCGVTKSNEPCVSNQTYYLHMSADPMKWEEADLMGDVPPPRWRHTATLLPDGDNIMMFGGHCKGRRYNDVHVLSVEKNEWSIKECAGSLPQPRSHHTASTIVEEAEDELSQPTHKVFILGGYGGLGTSRDFFMDVHFLTLDTWTWEKVPEQKGVAPSPRSDHCACVAGSRIILSGGRGWSHGKNPGFHDDVFVLETTKMEWQQPDGFNPEDDDPITWSKLPTSLWNHMARNIESVPTDRIFFFGGQTSPREFSNTISIMDAGTMEWTPYTMQGAAPPPREDCGMAYDASQCNLVFFGGWKQKWLDDLWILNVAGVVGPPYAIMKSEPDTGPLTGGTPVILHGLRFIESPMINVRFTDGKRDANCNGTYVSDTMIKCTSPDFSKFGAADVIVRLSISGDPFTVNETRFIYYANTQAKKSMAFGPGLMPGCPAGQLVSFIVQAKDLHGKTRTTGLDPLRVEITGPCKLPPTDAVVLDRLDGTYEVQYFVPTSGEYEITVSIDENPYDGNTVYMPVRGFPCKVDFGESWDEIKVGGNWPKLKGWMRAWAPDDASIVVVVKEEEDKGTPDYPSDRELGLVIDPPKPLPEPMLKFTELAASAIAKAAGDDITLRITQVDAPEGRASKDKEVRSGPADTSPESLAAPAFELPALRLAHIVPAEEGEAPAPAEAPPAAEEAAEGEEGAEAAEAAPPAPAADDGSRSVTLEVELWDSDMDAAEAPPLFKGTVTISAALGVKTPVEVGCVGADDTEWKLNFTYELEQPEPEPDEEEAEEEEEEAPPPAAEEPVEAEGEAGAEGEAAAAPEEEVVVKAPDMVYTLDIKSGVWKAEPLEGEAGPIVEVPDFLAKRDALLVTLEEMGVPGVLARAMCRPKTEFDNWSADGAIANAADGTCPQPRKRFTIDIKEGIIYVYGGCDEKGTIFYDDVWSLDVKAMAWTRVYACEIEKNLGNGRNNVWCGMKVIGLSKGQVGEALEVASVIDIGPMLAKREDKDSFQKAMTASVAKQIADITAAVTKVNTQLDKEVAEGDDAELHNMMNALMYMRQNQLKVEYDLDQLTDTLTYMRANNMGKIDPVQKKLDEALDKYSYAKKTTPTVKKNLKPLQDAATLSVFDKLAVWEAELEEYRAKFTKKPVFKAEAGYAEGYVLCGGVHTEMLEQEKKMADIAQLADLFEANDKAAASKEIVEGLRADLVRVKNLWDLSCIVESQVDDWKVILWPDIQPARMEEEAKAFQKAVKACDKAVRGWDVYRAIDASVKNFLVAMPCVSDLKSPSMRDRHWQKLMDVTKVTIDVKDPAFSLADLIALNLQDYVDDVGEVVDCANKEDKMEQTLVKLAETWKVVEFNFDQHADSDVYLIGLGEENFEMLEENQLVVQGMMASKYLATFEEEVTGWQKNLSSVSDVLGQMSETQRKWAYLETLFIGSDEVKKELPEDAARFAKIDVDFKAMLKHFKATPNCVESCSKDGLIPELETIAGDLELCEKALADFLEAKRIIFPRFYFVSQVMLLDILSNGNRPWTVLKNVNAMFQGVKEVKLSGDPAITVEAFESNEGERVEMATVMPKLKLDGKVENYLNLLIAKMRNEFRAKLEWVLKDYDITGKAGKDRPAWLANAPCAQLSLVTTQYRWTMECEIALNKMEKGTDMKALEEYYAFQIEMLSGMIKMVQGDLPKLLRRSAMNVITLEAHSRDISYKLVNEGVQSVDHFLWLGQLKTRWEKLKGHGGQTPALDGAEEHDCVLYICDALFRYSFEYLGCAGRLVITPLTDRIYITATQSAHLVLGCAPQGPAGTGKTESTKDLSAQLGKAVYVFNCGPEMDYRTMGDIFKGLASSGSWGCFDEFNRLMAEVLSVCTIQYKSVLEGIRAGGDNFRFNGKDVFLHPDGCMAFITMNPGYLGRQELPESLKVLFRPVTVMVPDFQLIMENMMMAEGYTEAAELAKKFFTLYNLAGDLLGGNPKPTGKQLHYDWGLRAINSVLKVAGEFLRNEKAELLAKGLSIETLEEGLLMRALRDFNLPKIGGDDNIVFMGLIRDLFAKVFELMPQMRDPPFEDLCRQMAVEEDKLRFPPQLTASTYFIANVVDLQALLALRHCVFVIGLSGNNKSETWKTLSKAWTKGGVMGKTVYKDINPKSITPNELYGFINMATREWKDGLLSSTMRDMANAPDANPKWIILDGDLDANWIENMNSVMDDNRLLTLASNERIRLLGNMKLLFEIRDLLYASPATVTRAGVLFISDEQQWKNYAQSWVDWWAADLPFQVKAEARKEMKAKAEELIEKYCGLVLLEIAMYYTHIVPLLEFGMIQALLNFLQGLWVIDNIGVKDASALEIYFVFACVWAFGGAMSITSGTDFRKKFSGYWKDTWKTIKFPHRGEIYDVFVDKAKKDFVPWSDVVPELNFDSATQQMSLVTVPTMETVATAFWLDNLLPHKHGAMLIGSAGCGKTALINGKLRSLPEEYSSLCVNINYYTNSFMYQKVIEAPLEKKAGKNFGPPGNKKMIYFVDDLNMAALDPYGTASNLSLMRQHIGYGHIYDMNKLSQKVLLNTQYLSAMNPTAGSFIVNPRLQRCFASFAIGFPSIDALNTIFQTFLLGHLSKFNEEVQEIGKKLVQAGMQLHKRVAATFRKTASNFHYEFNVRHVAGVFQGMLMGQPGQFQDPLKITQLWLHEAERTYGDRLVSVNDLKKYKDLAMEQAKKFFNQFSPPILFAEPLIFCHFAQGVGDKIYDRIENFPRLTELLTGALDEYNETNAAMNLVLFEDAMRHICRISRIIEGSGGHALMVGVGGMGKQSLARLATFINGNSAFQVVITSRYGVNDLKADLQIMYRKAGLKGEGISFIFTDGQIADERFLVYMNDLLSSGNIPGLFPVEDVDDIINAVRPLVKRAGLPDTRESCYDFFINLVRDNLHVILCFSPIGEQIKVRTRRFPALVNCVVIDWFQPWPEEALTSVSKKFLDDVDLGEPQNKENVMNFMPYSFLAVQKVSEAYEQAERRFNYTTPKSFLELIALFRQMLAQRRKMVNDKITKLSDGVIKLETTADGVGELEEEIKVKTVEVEAKKVEVDAMIPKLEEEKGKAGIEAAKANKIATEASAVEVGVIKLKGEIEAKLAAAEPALIAASAALESLNVKDLGELKSLKQPPAGVDLVTAACLCMTQTKDMPFKKVDTSWKAAQKMMSPPPAFLEMMLGFKQKIDDGLVPKTAFPNIQGLIADEQFTVETMKRKSNAAAGLTDFILNINIYNDINENVEPMRIAGNKAAEDLAAAIASKDAALAAKKLAEDTVAELTRQYDAANAEKEEVLAVADKLEKKLGLAQRLMTALSAEGARWKESIISLTASLDILTGDVLLASAFVSYIGCFNKRFRKELMDKTFVPYLDGTLPAAKGGVPMSEGVPDPIKILTTDAQIAGWNTESLPADRVSTENGAIVTSCARWPVMIDPQLQGIRWVKKHEEARGLQVVRLGQKTLMTTLGTSIENGVPVLIENIQLSIDAVLNPVIGRQTIKRGRNFVIKLGDKEVDYSPNFKLYLQTKLSNPHYQPEIQAETTLVNFMVTEDGLEDQLLAVVVLLERPDLAKQKDDLIQQQNNFKIKLQELEDGILEQLASAEGDPTENIVLIENLEASKATSIEVAAKMIIAAETEVAINIASEMYRPVANRGSLMFFLLSDLFKIHTFHFYSLNSFNIVYQRAIVGKLAAGSDEAPAVEAPAEGEGAAPAEGEEAGGEEDEEAKAAKAAAAAAAAEAAAAEAAAAAAAAAEAAADPEAAEARLQERLVYLVDNITYEVFDYCRTGLFEKHKLIVATMLTLRVLGRLGQAPADQVTYLIMGTAVPNPPPMTQKVQEYLTVAQWSSACAVKDVDIFKALPEDLELNVDGWREWIEWPNPESQDLPGDWLKKISEFSKLLLIRALRPDRATAALERFIRLTLGDRFMTQEPFSLAATFPNSTYQTPLFFVLFPGVDPGEEIEALGTSLGFTETKGNFVSISMGQGQEKNGENVLDRFTLEGGWAFLQNVHLMQAWLPILERKLEIATEQGHVDFRCFVTAEPPGLPDQMLIPEGIMQSAIKVACEPPTDVKSLFRGAWSLFSQSTFDKSNKKVPFKPMLFTLSFFHSLCLGRRKFGTQGFSRPYAWNNGDLQVCGMILHNYIEANADTPWADVRYLFGEVMYGGHITDPWDRRITATYLDVLLNPDLIDEKAGFELSPNFKPLIEGEYADYKQYIEERSPAEAPTIFGMHPNAEISLLNALASGLFFSILSVGGGGGGGGGGMSKEDKVSEIQVSLLEGLREDFNMVEIRTRIKEKGSPYVVFVSQELERMNKILGMMRQNLSELALGLSGALNISDAMDGLITALFMNQVPPSWLKTCGQIGPTGTYNRKNMSNWQEDLRLRWIQLEEWSAPTKPMEDLPPSVWLPGCFNPMGFVTASLQVTARVNQYSLDQMRVHIEVTDVYDTSTVESQPPDGAQIHGLFMENARWSCEEPTIADELEAAAGLPASMALGAIVESRPKELYPIMPMIHLTARTVDKAVDCLNVMRKAVGRYICPFYSTTVRGPTFVFAGPLRTSVDPNKWILSGAALVMQPD